MHMSDALISVAVGGTMLGVSGGIGAYSIKKVQLDLEEKKIPLMAVMGAFVFASQMINFAIPGTGSSGHIGGGMLLGILLGPYAGFLTMASVLLIQALFFGDGGLIAYGCNLFNIGFYTCFIAYPYIYKLMIRKGMNSKRIFIASIVAVVVGLQIGAFSVVLQTLFSGKSELPFAVFLLYMQPIHLAIGLIEGVITAAIISFVWKARPEILDHTTNGVSLGNISLKRLITTFVIATVLIGGVFSWFASSNPDGLEWSMEKTAGTAEIEANSVIHEWFSNIQDKLSFLPDYDFRIAEEAMSNEGDTLIQEEKNSLPINAGTSVAGLVGGVLTIALAALIGVFVKVINSKKSKVSIT